MPNFKGFGNPNVMRIVLLSAVVLFFGGAIISIRQQPDILSNLDWRPLVLLMALCVPLTILLNALEFELSARLLNKSVRFGKALEITVIGSAANMLPLPGAALARVLGLKAAGGGYKEGVTVTGLIALVWLGMAFTVAGMAITLLDSAAIGPLFFAAGIALTIFAVTAIYTLSRNWRLSFVTAIIKILFVALDALQIYLCLLGLGVATNYLQASAFVVASVTGSAVSIVPAGLGVREIVSAGLAPIVGLGASVGFLAASLNRLLGMLVLLPLALGLAIRLRAANPDAGLNKANPD